MAITDPLTRLCNRRHADQVLREELQRCERYSQPMSVAVFDIDHFKQFNDSFGHQAGDNVLLAVANALIDCTRSMDVCARIGGEEFLVIFPCTRLRDAEKVMARVQQVLASTIFPSPMTRSPSVAALPTGDRETALGHAQPCRQTAVSSQDGWSRPDAQRRQQRVKQGKPASALAGTVLASACASKRSMAAVAPQMV
jgi:diguanylate cyclase (GGDEF)-like protein